MIRSLRCLYMVMLLNVAFVNANAQPVFVDSVRSMLLDLDTSIQYAPINNLLKQSIIYCSGDKVSDSLQKMMKRLISEDYLLLKGLRQSVSPHLVTRYISFWKRIAQYILTNEKSDAADDSLRLAQVLIRGAYYDEARTLLQNINIKPEVSYYYLAQTYTNAYRPDSTYILLKLSLGKNANETRGENLLCANSMFLLANYLYAHNRRDSAYHLYQLYLDLQRKIHGDVSSEYAYGMIVVADMFNYLARYDAALDLAFRALEITGVTSGRKTWLYALCLGVIGEIYYRTGEYNKALPYSQQSLALKKELFGNEYFDNVVSLHNLATLYTRTGLYDQAIPLLEESLAISKKYFGELLVFAVEMHPLAEVYEYKGEYERALPLYQRSMDIFQQLMREDNGGYNNVYYPRVLHSIACLYTKLGQFDKAIEYFKQALAIKKLVTTEMSPEYTKTLNAFAHVCLLKGDFNKALSLQRKSLSIARRLFGQNHPDVAAGLFNLSLLYFREGNFGRAASTCKQALQMQISILGNVHPDVAISLDLLGNIHSQLKHYKEADNYFKRAFSIRQATMPVTHPDYITSLYNVGNSYVSKRKIAEGEKYLIKADSAALVHIAQSYITLSEEEKLIYVRKAEEEFQFLPSLLYLKRSANREIVNRVYNDAVVLKRMVMFHQRHVYNSIRQSGDSSALLLYNHWRFNKSLLGQQLLLPSASRISVFDSLQDATTRMEENLSRVSGSFNVSKLQFSTDIKQIQRKIEKNAAAIEFIRFRLFDGNWKDSIIYAAILLVPGKRDARFVPLCEERQLKNLLRFSNNTGEASVNYLYPAANVETVVSRELYKLIWKPIQPMLKNVSTIYYSSTGLLMKLSFAALHVGHGKFLCDQYYLKQLVCTRNINDGDSSRTGYSNAALWGGIRYGEAGNRVWKYLPATRSEIVGICSLLRQNNITCYQHSDTTATEEAFKMMDGNSPDLLHVATHGFFVPQPSMSTSYFEQNTFSLQQNPMLRSGLLLANANDAWMGRNSSQSEDGILTAYEISHLNLNKTKLVALSACETGQGEVGDYEGIFGLQRAFKMAGVNQVLMSLWTVPDNETRELMTLFYDALLKMNDAGKALRAAQFAMKKKYPPYFWAGFVMTE